MIDAALGPGRLLLSKAREKGIGRLLLRVRAGGFCRISGYVPGLPRDEGPGHAALGAVVPSAPLGDAPDLGYLGCGKKPDMAAPPYRQKLTELL